VIQGESERGGGGKGVMFPQNKDELFQTWVYILKDPKNRSVEIVQALRKLPQKGGGDSNMGGRGKVWGKRTRQFLYLNIIGQGGDRLGNGKRVFSTRTQKK